MAVLDIAAFTNALKVLYPKGLTELWYESSPFAAWVPKSEDFEGASKQVRPIFTGIRGSTSFTTALNAQSVPQIRDFTVTRVKDYVLGSIDNETLMASRSQKGAVAKAVDTQIKAAMYTFGRSTAYQVWRNGGGARGRIGTNPAGTPTITLANTNDVVNFEVGMGVQSATTDGTSGAGNGGQATITAIDRDAGTITVAGDWDAAGNIPAVATNDFLFREGDFGNCLAGVLGWVPTAAPTAGDNFFGVDRSVDPVRLAGSRVSGAGKTIEEAVFDAQAQASINGGRVDTLWMGSKRYAELCKSLQAKTTYEKANVKSDDGSIGFGGFTFAGERGPVTVVADPNCPNELGLLTRKSAWELCGLGKMPHFSQEDGLKFTRLNTADAIEFRLKAYWQMVCHRPVDNVLIAWDA